MSKYVCNQETQKNFFFYKLSEGITIPQFGTIEYYITRVSSIYFQTPNVDESEKFRYPFVRTHCFFKTDI